MKIPAPLRELAEVLAEGLSSPYRSFFRWNAAKALCALWGVGAALAFALPGLAALGWGVWAVQDRIPRDAVEALKGSGDMAAPAARIFEAVGVLPMLALALGAAWTLAAVSFAWFHASQVLYVDVLLRAAGGRCPARPPLAFSGRALLKSLSVAAWTALAWIPASFVFLLVAFAAKAAFGTFGAASVASPVTPWGLSSLLADPSAPILPYELFLWAWVFFVALGMSLGFGFAPLALASDASLSGTGGSYVAASWRAFRGRAFWSGAFVLAGCSLVLSLLGKLLALALHFSPVVAVPAAVAVLAAWGALRDVEGTPWRRAARALGAWAALCAAYFAAVTLASLPSLALGSYLGIAPVGLVAAFVFLGLSPSFAAALWRRRAAVPRP